MTLLELFGEEKGGMFRYQNGIFELLVIKYVWICRIGLKQWDGTADNSEQGMQRAFQCAADQVRPMFSVLVKLKKGGEL